MRACGDPGRLASGGGVDAEGNPWSSSVTHDGTGRRAKLTTGKLPWNACVTRTLTKREIDSGTPQGANARESSEKEWDRLRKIKRGEAGVREWDDVVVEARRRNIKAHQGRVSAVCVGKRIQSWRSLIRRVNI